MVRKSRRRYRKASDGKTSSLVSSLYDTGHLDLFALSRSMAEDRKTYAGKVKSLIEKKHRSVSRFRKSSALKDLLASFPKSLRGLGEEEEEEEEVTYLRNDIDYDPDLEEVYESQKLNFRRMISNLSKHIYEDSDFDSWSDLESNFSLIYEPLASDCHRDVDDVTLTLEKVKNMKNSRNVAPPSVKCPSWGSCTSLCDSWSCCTCSNASDASSYLSSCSCCRTLKSGLYIDNRCNGLPDRAGAFQRDSWASGRLSGAKPVKDSRTSRKDSWTSGKMSGTGWSGLTRKDSWASGGHSGTGRSELSRKDSWTSGGLSGTAPIRLSRKDSWTSRGLSGTDRTGLSRKDSWTSRGLSGTARSELSRKDSWTSGGLSGTAPIRLSRKDSWTSRGLSGTDPTGLSRKDSWSNSEYSQTFEPVSAERMRWSSRIKQLKKKLRASSLQRSLADQENWDSWSQYSNLASVPLPIASKEKRMQRLSGKPKEDRDPDTYKESVSLGLIYIPMDAPTRDKPPVPTEETLSESSGSSRTPFSGISKKSSETLQSLPCCPEEDEEDTYTVSGKSGEDCDPFGSLESLIFEPKESIFSDAPDPDKDREANGSVSGESQATITEDRERLTEAGQDLEARQDTDARLPMTPGGGASVAGSVTNAGCYWDWGRSRKPATSAEALPMPASQPSPGATAVAGATGPDGRTAGPDSHWAWAKTKMASWSGALPVSPGHRTAEALPMPASQPSPGASEAAGTDDGTVSANGNWDRTATKTAAYSGALPVSSGRGTATSSEPGGRPACWDMSRNRKSTSPEALPASLPVPVVLPVALPVSSGRGTATPSEPDGRPACWDMSKNRKWTSPEAFPVPMALPVALPVPSADDAVKMGSDSYWDWAASSGPRSQEASAAPPSAAIATAAAPLADKDSYAESSCVSEHLRSSLTSECKTCAGTSVASWTYIGLGKVVRKTGVDEQCAAVVEEMAPKKEVTWKIISEQNNKDVLELTGVAAGGGGDGRADGQDEHVVKMFEAYSSWSDLESLIFADEGTCTLSSWPGLTGGQQGPNRMSAYRDDWLFWDQQRKRRKMALPDRDMTWRSKARRMLLWMHYSQGQGGPPVEQWTWWKAKQRGSILWLICKANNNKVPDDLKDPYYRDHDDQDQLKPLVVHALARAEYYCLALGNIYADPNYHNLNHWGVIQALARKGVYVAEPSDVALTETVLIQTSPIRMSAHMAVIEAIMALYLKETVTVERIVNAVRRFVPPGGPIELPTDIEEALLFWINKVCVKMKHRIEDDMNIGTPEVQKDGTQKSDSKKASSAKPSKSEPVSSKESKGNGASDKVTSEAVATDMDKSGNLDEKVAPPIPLLQDLGDLSDGCCMSALISYYCPSVFRWQDICLNEPMSMADSLYNLQLVQKFCRDHLPYDPCFLTLEDMVYQHSSVRQNILVLLAELFFMFEVRPAKCVKMFGQRPEVSSPEAAGAVRRNGCGGLVSSATKRSFQNPVSPIPDLRNSCNTSYHSFPDVNRISPKSSTQTFRESLLPRRQLSQHERMQERSKRFSFTDGSKGPVSPSNSMRRTHSMQDIDKNGAEKPYADVGNYKNVEDEGGYPGSPISQGYFPQRLVRSAGREDDRIVYDDTTELYLRPLTNTSTNEDEPLMPAITRPAKEKSYNDSKPEEMGEYQRQTRPRGPSIHKRGSPKEEEKIERQPSPQRIARDIPKVAPKPDNGFYLNSKREIPYDYPDNQELEEQLAMFESGGKQLVLASDEFHMQKEGPESGIFVDRDGQSKRGPDTTSFAQLSKLREGHVGGINIVYMQHEREGVPPALKSSFLQKGGRGERADRKTSFAALPNQTTWQQHVGRSAAPQPDAGTETPTNGDAPLASQLCDVRLKLEEKRRRIESEKRKMELVVGRTRQKVGKAAFLQAVSKGRTQGRGTPDSGAGDEMESNSANSNSANHNGSSASEAMGGGDVSPEPASHEDYNRSIEQLSTNLSDLQSDIQRLTLQQEQIQQLMINGMQQQQPTPEPQGQFYLHDNSSWSPSRDLVYQPIQRSASREQLYQPMQRSQSIEQLYQPAAREQPYQAPLQRTASREQLYQPSSTLQRSASREQLYQPSLHRTMSREQLYQAPLQRSVSREQLYQPHQSSLQRAPSREQLYQAPMQRTVSREQLYQPQQLMHISPNMQQTQWGLQEAHRPVGAIVPQQHAYVDQSGYILHPQPPPSYQMAPQYIPVNVPAGMALYHNGDPYAQYGQYPTHYADMQPPYRLHIDVQGSAPPQPQVLMHGQSSRSQSPMMYHQPQQPSRPPSRPPSQPAAPGIGPLPAKAVPISAPPESFMEPQLVHFIDVPSADEPPPVSAYDEHLARETSRALASLDQAISGTATYRVTSPTRPVLGKTFRVPKQKLASPPPVRDHLADELSSPSDGPEPGEGDKGFFVSFDGETPKRPKPPLRTKKTPKSSKSEAGTPERENPPDILERRLSFEHNIPKTSPPRMQVRPVSLFDSSGADFRTSPVEPELVFDETDDASIQMEDVEGIKSPAKADTSGVGFIIGTELVNPDPTAEDEMARKKEKILMSVIKRREQQESARAKKEFDAAKRREQDRIKQETLERKKEEDRARRKVILEQYMQRKAAMEEQEGDLRPETTKTATLPKLKGKPMKPRPKSLHESALSAAEHRAADRMTAASGSRGSQTHLAGGPGEGGSYASSYRYADTDSGLGRSTPPRRAPSPGQHPTSRHLPSPSYVSPPGSLPPGLVSRRMGGLFSDTASDSCSTNSSTVEYTGPKLFKQPTAKSNRGIIGNAINTVLAGAVNGDMKRRILEEINRSESKHFLILFRDAGCQFRALYSYSPEKDEVFKLHGTGPKQITEKMIDKFYKYNCGGRNFTEIQTKHLTVTIDAFTIHNSLWQGRRVLPTKKEFF